MKDYVSKVAFNCNDFYPSTHLRPVIKHTNTHVTGHTTPMPSPPETHEHPSNTLCSHFRQDLGLRSLFFFKILGSKSLMLSTLSRTVQTFAPVSIGIPITGRWVYGPSELIDIRISCSEHLHIYKIK